MVSDGNSHEKTNNGQRTLTRADLADAVHAVTLIKTADTSDPAASEAERSRARELSSRLSIPVLARAWQMLLKGYDEVRASPRPLAAADMVLVRLAYASDLPTPGELSRQISDTSPQQSERPAPSKRNASASEPVASLQRSPYPAPAPATVEDNAAEPLVDVDPLIADPRNFEELVALAEEKRDLKLKHALCEQVRLVRFRSGHVELNPMPSASKELGQDLMKKLKAWTGRVWIVVLSGEEGEQPLGVQRREREAREIEKIRQHPDVKQLLERFPDARITAVRPLTTKAAEAEGSEQDNLEFKEDGTDP